MATRGLLIANNKGHMTPIPNQWETELRTTWQDNNQWGTRHMTWTTNQNMIHTQGRNTWGQGKHDIRCVRLEAALRRMISVWHQSTAASDSKHKDPSALLSLSWVLWCHTLIILCSAASSRTTPNNSMNQITNKSESEMTRGQVWWPILGICALHLSHPKCTHTAVNTHTWSR